MSYKRFTVKLHQVFSVHSTLEELKRRINQPVILDLCLRKAQSEKLYDYGDAIVSEKLRIQSVFRPHENAKPAL